MICILRADFFTKDEHFLGIFSVVYNPEDVMTDFHHVVCLPWLFTLAPLWNELGHLIITAQNQCEVLGKLV